MKKIIRLSIMLGILVFSSWVDAKVSTIGNPEEVQTRSSHRPNRPKIKDEIPNPESEAFDEFMVDRLKNSISSDISKVEKSVSVAHSSEYIAKMEERNKSTFEKIYDEALKRVTIPTARDDIAYQNNDYYKQENLKQKKEWEEKIDFEVVEVVLPNGEKTLVPAKEHIPYMFSSIEILPSGLVKIKETITVVANGQKLKNGLSRSLPRYSKSREGTVNKVGINLISVLINGQSFPYRIDSEGSKLQITPMVEYTLQPGVYTYTFNYILDRQLWNYENFKEFYWDVTGSSWNLVIGKAGAEVILPGASTPLSQLILLGYKRALSTNNAKIIKGNGLDNVLGFAAKRPLFIGEGMHIIISMPLSDFVAPDMYKKISWLVEDYGDIIFACLGLLAILGAYYLSWKNMVKNNKKYTLKKNASILRYLLKGTFDKKSFGAFLLELYRKNIIDIQSNEQNILLVKRTDNLTSLSSSEKKAIHCLFNKEEAVFNVNENNKLRLMRAYKIIEKETNSKIKNFTLKLNLGYIIFSSMMLLLTILAIALLSVNPIQTGMQTLGGVLLLAFYIWILNKKIANKYVNVIIKSGGVLALLATMLFMSGYINAFSVILFTIMIYAIFAYTFIFSKRNGLIRNNVKDAQSFKEYLTRNAEALSLGRDFISQQANIVALDVEDRFENNPQIKDYYKLDLINSIIKYI